jgi:integrase
MSVRKGVWKTSKGVVKSAFVLDYVDRRTGKRYHETFPTEKKAKERALVVGVGIRDGTHTARSDSVTVSEAGEAWLKNCAAGDKPLERTTLAQYGSVFRLHIEPHLGHVKLADLTAPMVRTFANALRDGTLDGKNRSGSLTRTIIGYLGAILVDAFEVGLVAQNVVANLSNRKKRHRSKATQQHRITEGEDFPNTAEIAAIAHNLKGRWRPLILCAIATGLRASELRGLRWADVDLVKGEIRVCQRADKFLKIDKPKSTAGTRTVPIGPFMVNTLKEWRLACPKGPLDLAFPTAAGGVATYNDIVRSGFRPAQIRAGVVKTDAAGKRKAKYRFHSLRHRFASWCINRRVDGGLELPVKTVQARLGHSSITMTMDVYGHLFPRGDDGQELAASELGVFGLRSTKEG